MASKQRTATVYPSSSRGVHIPGEGTYVLIDHARLDVLIGTYMELLDILPSDQGAPLKKQIKKISREWLDGYYDQQALRQDSSSFYGYDFDDEPFPNDVKAERCYVAGLDEVFVLEPKQVPAFNNTDDRWERSQELTEAHNGIWKNRSHSPFVD